MSSSILEAIAKSPLVEKILDQDREEGLAARKAAVAAIEEIRRREQVEFAAADATLKAAEKTYNETFERQKAASAARMKAYSARASICDTAIRACGAHERLLRETADPRITTLAGEISANYPARVSPGTAPSTALMAVSVARRECLRELEILHLEALSPKDLRKRLDDIRARAKLPSRGE